MSSKASKLKLRAEFPPLVDIVPKTPKKQKKPLPEPPTIHTILWHVWNKKAFINLLETVPIGTELNPKVFVHAKRLGLSQEIMHDLLIYYVPTERLSFELIEWLIQHMDRKLLLGVLDVIKNSFDFDSEIMALAEKYGHDEFIISWLRQYC